jgi:hypothetical protein
VAKTSLAHKSTFLILPTTKRKFLSIENREEVIIRKKINEREEGLHLVTKKEIERGKNEKDFNSVKFDGNYPYICRDCQRRFSNGNVAGDRNCGR